jgi:hypothetical protein
MIRRLTLTTILLFAVIGFATAAVAGQTATATPTVTETPSEANETPNDTEDSNETDAGTPDPGPDENASENAVGPGERLSGVLGVQEAELEGEVANRTYGIQVAQAASSSAKAKVVGEQLADIEARIEALESERDRLEEARDNGSISQGEYRARVATLSAKQRSVERLTNTTNDSANGLPEDVLQENGVNATAIRTLQTRASELTGPEVAAIARSIAGPPADVPGQGPPERAGPPGDRNGSEGPPADAGNRSDDGRDRGARNGDRGNDSAGDPDEVNETEDEEMETEEATETSESEAETTDSTETEEADAETDEADSTNDRSPENQR